MEDQEILAKRLEEFKKIEEQTWSSVQDLGSGIFVYHDVLPQSMDIISRLESVLLDDSNNFKY